MKRVLAALVPLTLALLTAPVGAQSPTTSDEEKLVLRLGMENQIDSLNPFKIVEIPAFEVMGLSYDLLVEFSQEDFSPAPGLAEEWEVSDDGLEWTFHLREDAMWSDGEPVTSADVEYTWNRILEEEQGSFIDYIRQVQSIETPDEHTIVMRTEEPSVQMLAMFVYVLPKHIWEDVPEGETKSFKNEPVVGSGPYQAVEWQRGQFVRLERNPHFPGEEPAVDEIIFQFYDNADTMVQALKQGEVDYILNPPVNLFNSLENEPNIETLSAPDPGFTELAFNLYEPSPDAVETYDAPRTSTGHPALLDERVREAINWAINEQELTDKVLSGEGVPGTTLVPPSLTAYHLELPEEERLSYDIDRARELLAEAGWEDTNNNGTVDKGDEELELRLFVRAESPNGVKEGQFVKGWLEEAGIRLDVKAVSDTTLTDDIYAADYDMFIWGWGSDQDPDFILSVLTCEQFMFWSDTFYCNEDYSRLYQEQKQQLDLEERAETIREMQQIAYEDNPYIIFYYDNQFDAYRTDKFEGWMQSPATADVGQVLFNPSISTYLNLRPVSAGDSTSASSGGVSPIVWVLVALVAVLVIALLVGRSRRGSMEDRD